MDIENASTMLEVRTVQVVAFKTLIEAMKELLTDTCIEFDEQGMKITAVDSSRIVLVHLRLDADKFEHYYAKNVPGNIVIGVNMINLHKLIKTCNGNDTLSFSMDASDTNHLSIKIENADRNTRTVFKLSLLDLDKETISIDPAEFNSVISMPSTDLQKICRDMHNIASLVEIRNVGSELIFSCSGEFVKQETTLSDASNFTMLQSNASNGDELIGSNGEMEIVQGIFSLKHLVLFTKCTNLSSTVELYLKNDYALIVKYRVSSLGEIKLCLAPQNSDAALPR